MTWHTVRDIMIGLLSGAALTTTAEYFFKYNLLNLIIEKVKGLFGKAKADVVAEVAKVKGK